MVAVKQMLTSSTVVKLEIRFDHAAPTPQKLPEAAKKSVDTAQSYYSPSRAPKAFGAFGFGKQLLGFSEFSPCFSSAPPLLFRKRVAVS